VKLEKDEDGHEFEDPIRFAVEENEYNRILLGESRLAASVDLSLVGIRRVRKTQLTMLGEAQIPKERKKSIKDPETKKGNEKSDEKSLAAKSAAIDWSPEPIRTQPDSYKLTHWRSGKIKAKEPIIKGKINGIGQYWFENGQQYGEIPYVDGKKHGVFMLYREDGSADQRLSYKNGKLHGPCIWYNRAGTKATHVAVYADGEVFYSKKHSD
jgi:hypothetical protein